MDEQAQRSRSSRIVRWLVILVVALAVLALLFLVVFPWVEAYLENPTLGAAVGVSAAGRG